MNVAFLFIVQAADIVQLVGIGRNEYIAIMNKCKAKKLLWRVNKSIAKEFLPTSPLDLNMQPWWKVGVVNLSTHLDAPPCCCSHSARSEMQDAVSSRRFSDQYVCNDIKTSICVCNVASAVASLQGNSSDVQHEQGISLIVL